MKMLKVFAFFSLAFQLGTPATGQAIRRSESLARMEQVVESYVSNKSFMGAVLVAGGADVLLNRGYGAANLDWDIPNDPDVKFRLGSLTKQFTATLVLLLQEDGKLRIADPIGRYLPDTPKAWQKINLGDLLGQTSGIPDLTEDARFAVWSMSAHTPAEELAFFRDKPVNFEPGAKFSYSNSNYLVLGNIIEKVCGKSYGEMLRERIFDPLHMNGSGLDADDLVLRKRALGYVQGNSGFAYARSESMTGPYSAGGLYSTTGDLLKWEHALFAGRVLSPTSLKMMTTPGKGNYGFGLQIDRNEEVTVISHSGVIEGFSNRMNYVPERQIAVIVLGNVASGSAAQAMADELTEVALGRSIVLASERKKVSIYASEVAKFVGTFDLSNGSVFRFEAGGNILIESAEGVYWMLTYLGLQNSHPAFYLKEWNAVIEFVPDMSGAFTKLIFRRGGLEALGKRR